MEIGVTEVVVATISAISVIAVALIQRHKIRLEKHKTHQAVCEMKFQQSALDFSMFIQQWEGTYEDINNLFNETNVDRFLILRAWNGLLDPKWTTAICQIRKSDQPPRSYIHYELDSHYVESFY